MPNGEERRKRIVAILTSSSQPQSGSKLSERLAVSRQVIVQDIALLRAAGHDIVSTNRGYICQSKPCVSRIFKVCHSNEAIAEELNAIVDLGARVTDVFVNHKVYGRLKADMDIASRRDVQLLLEQIEAGKSSPLLNITSGYHYHTVEAESELILDLVEKALISLAIYCGTVV